VGAYSPAPVGTPEVEKELTSVRCTGLLEKALAARASLRHRTQT